MKIVNAKSLPFVSTNGPSLRLSKAAQQLLCNPKRADISVDFERKLVTVTKNDISGEYKVTYFNRHQCQICIYQLAFTGLLKDKTRYAVHAENDSISFEF